MSKFVIFQTKSGEFQFSLRAGNGQEILKSISYSSRTDCDHAIHTAKSNAQELEYYQRLADLDGQAYFTLINCSGQIIGISDLYECSTIRDNGIISVMKIAPRADISDIED